MSSGSTSAGARLSAGELPRLLRAGFGFFVWAAHFLFIYIAEAVACQLSVVSVLSPGAGLIAVLATVTVLSALVVAMHGWHVSQRRGPDGDNTFLAHVGLGGDAIAMLAILWQLMPLFMVPLCR